MRQLAGLVLMAAASARLWAQLPLTPEAEREFKGVFEERGHRSLGCRIETFKPFLDFSFRYEIGYVVTCPLKLFEGRTTSAGTVLRVQPKEGKAKILGQSFTVPGIPDTLRGSVDLHHLRQTIEFSGVFVAGEGEYDVDLIVMDDRDRACRKHWHAAAFAHGNESQAAVAMPPGAVGSVSLPRWSGTSDTGSGLRLTVLLDAAPMNPYSRRLRVWDQAFLLGSLSSLLRGIQLASVRVVAFNLDQQQIVYQEEEFDRLSMQRLAGALQKLELGSISYSVLKHEEGWSELLTELVKAEYSRTQPSDAVVFLGPDERFEDRIEGLPEGLPHSRQTAAAPPIFYLKYYPRLGSDFPDAIQRLTSACKGTTYKVHSPGDLAEALTSLQHRLGAALSEGNLSASEDGRK